MDDLRTVDTGLNAQDQVQAKALENFWQRSDQQSRMKEFLAANQHRLGLQEAKSMISIGPAIGEIDSYLISTCSPKLSEYYGIEPNAYFSAKLGLRLGVDNPSIDKVHIVNQLGEDWAGPSAPVDVVLLFHVLYYIPYNRQKEFFARCRGWLGVKGIMIIVVLKGDDLTLDLHKLRDTVDSSGDSREILDELRCPFEEFEFEITMDLHGPYQEVADMVYKRKATLEEVEMVGSCCKKYTKDGEYGYKSIILVRVLRT